MAKESPHELYRPWTGYTTSGRRKLAVNDFSDPEVGGQPPQSGDRTMRSGADSNLIFRLKAGQQGIGVPQVGNWDGPRLPVDPTRFDNAPVRLAPHMDRLEACHSLCIHCAREQNQPS